jgi:hypothetical protein
MTTQLKNYVKAGKDVQTAEMDTLIREYKQKRWVANSEKIGKPDSLSAWYSIEEMENFIALAKSNGGDGIRFYYGAYPENHKSEPEYAERQTLVKVATRSRTTASGNTVNKDLFLTQNGQLKILSGLLPKPCPPVCAPSEGGMGDLGITLVDKGDKGMEII